MSDTSTQGPAVEQGCVLDEVEGFLRRFVAFPSESAVVATVLWAAHTHLLECFDSTPRLAFLSPEPGSGKTRALEILATLVPFPMHAVNATTSAMFRSIASMDSRPTILFDEIDTVFGPKAKENEDLRGLLNAGHRRSGVSYRCVGDGTEQKVVAFPSYAALGLAGLGELPDTILTRSVIIRMRRRAPNETVEPYRERIHEPQGHQLHDALTAWADSIREPLVEAPFPEMPPGVTDRPADVWEPLLMVADAARGAWPQRARTACLELVSASQDPGKVSLGVRLLADLRTVFNGADRMPTDILLTALCALDDAPWAELAAGRPLDSRRLARMLAKYTTPTGDAIKPRVMRQPNGTVPRGYHAEDLADAWARYLPPMASHEEQCVGGLSATRHTSATPDMTPDQQKYDTVALVADVADLAEADTEPEGPAVAGSGSLSATRYTSATENGPLTSGVADVADVADLRQADKETPVAEVGQCSNCRSMYRRLDPTDYPDLYVNHPTLCSVCAPSKRAG